MSGRFNNRWRYRNRVRYARGRYSGRRVGAARRARGNQRAANQQNDISNVTINLMKKIKTGVIGYGIKGENNMKKIYEIGTCALNIFELLRQSEFYQSYSNMYDQFRINRIQVKVTPVTWQTYNQFNMPNATANSNANPPVPQAGIAGGEAVYPDGYSHPDNGGENTSNTKYIVPQALTIVTAWDRTGLDDTQLSTGVPDAELPLVENLTLDKDVFKFTTIGDKITTYSSARSTQLVAGANFNCVRYLYPSSQQEKSLYFSTSELVEQVKKHDALDKWYTIPVSGTWDSKNITNLHSDPNCPFKPTFLIGVLKVDDLSPIPTSPDTARTPDTTNGQIYPVTFNLEFDIGVTFRGLRKTQVVIDEALDKLLEPLFNYPRYEIVDDDDEEGEDENDEEDEEMDDEDQPEPIQFITLNSPLNPNYDPNDPNSKEYIPYNIRPTPPFIGMEGVDVYVKVPTQIVTLPNNASVVVGDKNIDVTVQVPNPQNPQEMNTEIIKALNTVNENLITVGTNGARLVETVGSLSTALNDVNRDLNEKYDNLNANYNNVIEVKNKLMEDVKANADSIQTITEEQQQIQNRVTSFNSDIVTQLENINSTLASNTLGIRNLGIQMTGNFYETFPDPTTNKRKKNYQPQIHNIPTADNFVFQMPEDLKQKQKDEENNNNNNMEQDENQTGPSNSMMVKRFKGHRGEDVTRPTRGVYYDVQNISIDGVNTKYNEKNYAMFDCQNVNEIRLLDIVTLNITENDNDYEWDIVDNYINTATNVDEQYPNGFNPLGVKRFKLNIDVQTNRLKDMNEWEQLSTYAFANNNTALIKYNPNNQIEPQEIENQRRDLVLDEYQGDGKTIYDPNEKIFINNHKYTFSEENEEYDENIEGFKSVMQTTIIPIIDRITIPEITRNTTLRYSIEDFNNIYSLTPGSQNTYRNDFIGFNSIDIPVKVNNKVVPLLATQDGIYRPSDIDQDAIGFSSVQVSTTTRSGGGSGGSSVFNLENYTFRENTNQPYTINEYNQQYNTNYTGFDSINVDVGEMNNLNLIIDNPGSYNLNYNVGEDPIVPNLNSNNNQFCILTGSYNYGGDSYTYYKMFDSDQNSYYSNYTQHGPQWFKIEFLENVSVDMIKLYTCNANNGINFSLIVNGSNDDVDYTELWSSSTNIKDYDSATIAFDNSKTYKYYKFETDGKCEIRVMQFYKYSGGYKNVNIKVDTGKNNISLNKVIENIENNVTTNYYPVDGVESLVPNMTSDNSNNVSIIASDRINDRWRLFSKTVNDYTWINPDKNYTPYLILQMDAEIIPMSFFMSFYKTSDSYRRLTYFKLSASKDNLIYDELLELENFNSEALQYDNNRKYIYKNLNNVNEESYLYFKLEFRGDNNDWPGIWYCKIMDVEKYNAIDKLTVINNTYSKTADPVVSNLEPNNQRVYVNTSDSSLYPYVRRNWMAVPLEDKVIKYKGYYNPTTINVSSGYYGIKSVTFENEGVYVCNSIVPLGADSSNVSDNNTRYTFDGGYIVSNRSNVTEMFDNTLNNGVNGNFGGQTNIHVYFDVIQNINNVQIYTDCSSYEVRLVAYVAGEQIDCGTVAKNIVQNQYNEFEFYSNTYYSDHWVIYFRSEPYGDSWWATSPGTCRIMHCESDTSPFEYITKTYTKNGHYTIDFDQENYVAIRKVDLNIEIPSVKKEVIMANRGDMLYLPNEGIFYNEVEIKYNEPIYNSCNSLITGNVANSQLYSSGVWIFNNNNITFYGNVEMFNRLFYETNSEYTVDVSDIDIYMKGNSTYTMNSVSLYSKDISYGKWFKVYVYYSNRDSDYIKAFESDIRLDNENTWYDLVFDNYNKYQFYKIEVRAVDNGKFNFMRVKKCIPTGYNEPSNPLYENYNVTYTENGQYTFNVPSGYSGIRNGTVTVSVPILPRYQIYVNPATLQGHQVFNAPTGYVGMGSVEIITPNDPEYKLSLFHFYYDYDPLNNDSYDLNTQTNYANYSVELPITWYNVTSNQIYYLDSPMCMLRIQSFTDVNEFTLYIYTNMTDPDTTDPNNPQYNQIPVSLTNGDMVAIFNMSSITKEGSILFNYQQRELLRHSFINNYKNCVSSYFYDSWISGKSSYGNLVNNTTPSNYGNVTPSTTP